MCQNQIVNQNMKILPTTQSPKENYDDDFYPCSIPLDLVALFVEPDDFVLRVSTIDTDSDPDETTLVTTITYEKWRERETVNLNYQGEIYVPPLFQENFEKEQSHQSLLETIDQQELDE